MGGGTATVSCEVSKLGLIPGQLIFQQEYHNQTKGRDRREGGNQHYEFLACYIPGGVDDINDRYKGFFVCLFLLDEIWGKSEQIKYGQCDNYEHFKVPKSIFKQLIQSLPQCFRGDGSLTLISTVRLEGPNICDDGSPST